MFKTFFATTRPVSSAAPALPTPPPDWVPTPDSMAWRVNGEIVTILGWGPAVLLQFAHPLVAAGVAQHSRFRDAAHKNVRFHNTLKAMLDMTFGAEPQIRRATRRINGIHTTVKGDLGAGVGPTPGGTRYSALDPELLLWVQATTAEMMLNAYAMFVRPLSVAERDQYLAEVARGAPELGIPAGMMPANSVEMAAYFARIYAGGVIVVGDEARELTEAVLNQLPVPLVGRVLRGFLCLPIAGLLPDHIRVQYGFRWDKRRAFVLHTWAAANRVFTRVAPRRLHRWPVAVAAERRAARA